jgi:hypothetical protein
MAFQNNNSTQVGTKGSDVYTATGVDDPRVALSVLLVQGCDAAHITSGLDAILSSGDKQMIEDAFVLLFQARDIRGGKGIRDVSQTMIRHFLTTTHRAVMLELLSKIPEYGSWRDLKVLALESTDSEVRQQIANLFANQILDDEVALSEGSSASISLVAKYAPRECHKDRKEKELAKQVAHILFPFTIQLSSRMGLYRKRLSALNRYLDTTEVKMCGKQFADIDPSKVPGRCLTKNTKAFLNQPSTYKKPDHPRPSAEADRVACAEHFTEHFAKAAKGEAKVNGSKTVYPHELIKKIVGSMGRRSYSDEVAAMSSMSQDEKNAIVGVWNQMVKDAKAGGGLGRSLAMCDFSGSMQSSGSNGDTPYWVSMALGLLISEVTTKEFEDVFLTFDSNPTFHQVPKGDIFQRVASISDHIAQGTSTDFQKAMDLVLARLKQTRCKPGEEPENLIVLTDMNWDQACSSSAYNPYTGNHYRHVVKTDSWQTHVEMIREAFKRAGEDMWGSDSGGWKMPTIVIWNIAATSTDFHAKADTEGVAMLSGWSPSLFRVLQSDGIVSWTPYQALRIQLDDPRYDPVREKVREMLKQ